MKKRKSATALRRETRAFERESREERVESNWARTSKANGAGIAADPTLTSAWALLVLRTPGRTIVPAPPSARLALGFCSASGGAFQINP